MPHQCTNCGHTFPDGSKEMLSGCPDCGGNKFQFHPDAVPDDPPDGDAPDPPEDDPGVAERVGRAANTVRDFVGDSTPDVGAPEDAGPAVDADSDADADAEAGSVSADAVDGTDRDHGEWPDADLPDGSSAGDRSPAGSAGEDAPAAGTTEEDSAQADARSEVVEPDSLPDPDQTPGDALDALDTDRDSEDRPSPDDGTVVSAPEMEADDGDGGPGPGLSDIREELNDQFESIRVVAPGQYELNLMELYDREEYIIALQENGRYVIEVPDTWREDDV